MGDISVSPVDPYRYAVSPDLFSNIMVNSYNAETGRQNANTSARAQSLNEIIQPQELAIRNRQQTLAEQIEPGRLAVSQRQVSVAEKAQVAQEDQFAKTLPLEERKVKTDERQVGVQEGRLGLDAYDAYRFGERKMRVDEIRNENDSRRVKVGERQQDIAERNNPAEQARANINAAAQGIFAENVEAKRNLVMGDSQRAAVTTLANTTSAMQNDIKASQTGKAADSAAMDAAAKQRLAEERQRLTDETVHAQFSGLMTGIEAVNDPRYIGSAVTDLVNMAPATRIRNAPFINGVATKLLDHPLVQRDPELAKKLLKLQTDTEEGITGAGSRAKGLRIATKQLEGILAGSDASGVSIANAPPMDGLVHARLGQLGLQYGTFGKSPFTEETKDGETKALVFHAPGGDIRVPVTSPAFNAIAKMSYEGGKARAVGLADPLPPVPPKENLSDASRDAAGMFSGYAEMIGGVPAMLTAPFRTASALVDRAFSSEASRAVSFQQKLAATSPVSFDEIGQHAADPDFIAKVDNVTNKALSDTTPIQEVDASIDALAESMASREYYGQRGYQVPAYVKSQIQKEYGIGAQGQALGIKRYLTEQARTQIIKAMSPIDQTIYWVKKKGSGEATARQLLDR